MSAMREILHAVARLSEEYEAKRKIHEQEHGAEGGAAIGSEKADHFLEATRLLDRKLRSYLDTLSEDDLRKLETLVYFGRGDDDDLRRLHEEIRSTSPTREDVARTIAHKIGVLSQYLPDAIFRAEELAIDLDEPFA